ncbi:hypothetical protein [Streptomyces sp. NPDC088752]|uniref:hypothetical protein n=1 Tax=Streptomyces sp. NPDC088752 TaxID=3154963 RepID=UPI00341380E4
MSTAAAERPVLVDPTAEQLLSLVDAKAGPVRRPPADMGDLTTLVRTFMGVVLGRPTRERLGGDLFDVVITAADDRARAAVAAMDEVQGGCGGVVEDPAAGWLYWLVPPGSAGRWQPHPYAVCLSTPYKITLPPLNRTAPPGPYWYRPAARDRLVPAGPLWKALEHHRPEPTPHAPLAAQLGISPERLGPPGRPALAPGHVSGPTPVTGLRTGSGTTSRHGLLHQPLPSLSGAGGVPKSVPGAPSPPPA